MADETQQESYDNLSGSQQDSWQELKERNPDLGELATFNLRALRRRERATIGLLVVVLLALLLVVFKQGEINGDLNAQLDAIHSTQVSVCKQSLAPGGVRFILADQIRSEEAKAQKQLDQSNTFDYSKFFPNVSPDELAALVKQQKQQLTREINGDEDQVHDLLAVDCSITYQL